MPHILALLAQLQLWLVALQLWLATHIHPYAPALLLIGAIWAPQYAIRRWRPTWWQAFATFGGRVIPNGSARVEYALKVWQGLPSLMFGALVGAVTTGGDPTGAVVGALLGACAPLKHHVAKWLPWISYRGGAAPAASEAPKETKKIPPLGLALFIALLPSAIALLLAVLSHGCSDYPEVVRPLPDAGSDECPVDLCAEFSPCGAEPCPDAGADP